MQRPRPRPRSHHISRRQLGRLGWSGLGALALASAWGPASPRAGANAQEAPAPAADVVQFKPALTRPPDFAAFWKQQLDLLAHPQRGPVEYRLTPAPDRSKGQARAFDLRFPSVDGRTEVWGWYATPAPASAPPGDGKNPKLPALLTIPAYSGRRGPGPRLYPGIATLVVGYRGHGDEPWPKDWITRGLDQPENSVFRLHYLNLVLALRFLQGRPEVDARRIYLEGGSLGGAMTVVLAGLVQGAIAGLVASEPGIDYYFYADGRPAETSFKLMEQFVADHPAQKAAILKVLDYYAPLNFAPDVTAAALFSCGGQDPLCFPKMVYALYNHLGGPKEIRYYPEAMHGKGPGLSDDWPKYSREWLLKRIGAR